MRLIHSLLAISAAAVLVYAGPGAAQDLGFPKRPIHLIVPFAPGAGVDVAARLIGAEMAGPLGQPITIDNRPGAAGQIGVQAMLAAPADGYTLVANSNGALSTAPHLRGVPYDFLTDLLPVGIMYTSDYVIAVNRDYPAQNLKELIDASRTAPQALNFGVSGIASHHHLAVELIKMMSGARFNVIAYGTWPKAVLAASTGELPAAIADTQSVQPFLKEGKVRILAVTGARRQRVLPDVPTVAQAGLSGYAVDGGVAIFVAARTPQSIVDRLRSGLERALAMPAIQDKLRAANMEPGTPMTQDQLRALVKSEYDTWGRVVKAANIQPQ